VTHDILRYINILTYLLTYVSHSVTSKMVTPLTGGGLWQGVIKAVFNLFLPKSQYKLAHGQYALSL